MLGGKKNKERSPDATDTLIGEATVVEGKIRSQAGLRIEGKVYGDIECAGDITVGVKGQVFSKVTARNIMNAGTIEGSIVTKGQLHITGTGKVSGDIEVGSLIVAQGGLFNGTSTMDERAAGGGHGGKDENTDTGRPQLSKVEKIAAAK